MYRLKVKEIATQKGYNISQLSRKSDVEIKTVRRLFHNPTYAVGVDILDKIALALEVDIAELIESLPEK